MQSLLASSAALLAFAVAWPLVSQSCDDLAGPHPVAADVLVRARWASDLAHRFVEVECSDVVSTGVVWEEIHTSHGVETSRTSTPFWATHVGSKFLLIRSPTKPAGKFAGQVGQVDSSLTGKFDETDRPLLLPISVTEEDPRVGDIVGNAIVLGIAGWFTYLTVRSVRRFIDPRRHPAIARLVADADIRDISKDAEREIAGADAVPFRGRILTPHFFLDRRWPRFQLRRWSDLVWAYAKVTQHRHWFIPTGKTHELVLAFDDGTKLTLNQRSTLFGGNAENDVASTLGLVGQRAPWAVFGFDQNRQRTWRKERAALCAAVAKRRAEILAAPPAPAS